MVENAYFKDMLGRKTIRKSYLLNPLLVVSLCCIRVQARNIGGLFSAKIAVDNWEYDLK